MNIDDKESDSLFGNPLKSIERLIAPELSDLV